MSTNFWQLIIEITSCYGISSISNTSKRSQLPIDSQYDTRDYCKEKKDKHHNYKNAYNHSHLIIVTQRHDTFYPPSCLVYDIRYLCIVIIILSYRHRTAQISYHPATVNRYLRNIDNVFHYLCTVTIIKIYTVFCRHSNKCLSHSDLIISNIFQPAKVDVCTKRCIYPSLRVANRSDKRYDRVFLSIPYCVMRIAPDI